MTFQSILFERAEDRGDVDNPPAFFCDLNLDQVVNAITKGREEYDLKPFFYQPLRTVQTVEYRHAIMRDLENSSLYEHVKSFAQKIRAMNQHLSQAQKLYYKYQKQAWFLDAVEIYCDAVNCLKMDISTVDLKSRGLIALRAYLKEYIASRRFQSLYADTKKLKVDLSRVKYCVLIRASSIKVRKYVSEADYGADVVETFTKFKQDAINDYKTKLPSAPDMNHVEAKILEFVVRLYAEIFQNLDDFCGTNRDYPDDTIAAFDRESQFYIAWLEYTARFKNAGLEFCYPQISDTCKEVYDYEGFDLALADKLISENESVVCNDFYLKEPERVIVVSGPNQGGKTTFARMFGQLHYLASLGCPVPGREAQLLFCDKLLTHFEREENSTNLRGKLQDDLIRVHDVLNQATSSSIIIMNEILTSTTLQDAVFLSKNIMEKIVTLDAVCVWVTFIDEMASFNERTVSMVSSVVPGNPALRTYKISRSPADGLAYAMAIAEKYRLTYDCIRERIKA